ncbi:MAG TPA: efflux RND transporter periplasmic adaptor subunit [Steroidobacteraceae bacterium]|jgi:membrane fusion protein (multidrug efflux system)
MKNIAVSLTAGLALAACGKAPAPPAPPAPEVTVQTVDSQPVPLELTYPARTVGSREVEVRARVGGIVLKRRFQEGSWIKQGEPMFLIDPEPVRARVASARAEVAVAKARLEEARRNRDRVLPLFEKNAVSQSRRDEAVSGYDVAAANLQSAESQQRMAQLDLEYTDVRAPISGLTSREVLSEGSLVSTDQQSSLLTKIVQVDPLYIEFTVPEGEAAMIRSGLAPANQSARPPGVKLVLENGSEYPQAAQVTFVDNAVDVNSGTVRVRAVLPNKDAQLIPGQFLRAKVEGVVLSNVVSVPRKAIMSGPQGSFVWVVGADSKAQMRPVQVGRSMGNNVIVTDGLHGGDRYIVEGVMKVMQPGIQVSAVTAEEAAHRQQQAAPPPKEAA